MDEKGIVLEFRLHDFTLADEGHNGQSYQTISVEGMTTMAAAGQPQVPSLGQLIGTPTDGITEIRILQIESETKAGVNLAIIPALTDADSVDNAAAHISANRESDRPDEMLPHAPAAIRMTGKLREQPVAQLIINPFQYNPAQQTLRINRRIQIAVDFAPVPENSAPENRAPENPVPEDKVIGAATDGAADMAELYQEQPAYETVLQSTLLNYAALPPIPAAASPATSSPAKAPTVQAAETKINSSPRLKITIDETGIYRVPYAWIQAAGFDLTDVDPRKLQLHILGEETAIFIQGEEDGQVDSGDWIAFYGQATESLYAKENVYWLSVGESLGLRIQDRDGTPVADNSTGYYYLHSERWESNQVYWKDMPAPEEGADGPDDSVMAGSAAIAKSEAPNQQPLDYWFWDRFPSAPTEEEYKFTLANVLQLPEAAEAEVNLEGRITVRLHGRTETQQEPDHHTLIYLNGRQIDDVWWDGQVPLVRQIQLPQRLLVEGENTLKISMPGDTESAVDSIYFDYFEVTHWAEQFARADQLALTTPTIGPQNITVGRFSSPGIEVYDVRNPLRTRRIINGDIRLEELATGSTYRINFGDSLPTTGDYLLIQASQKRTPLDIQVVQPPTTGQTDAATGWKSPERQADYLIITHPDFIDAIAPLAQLRQDSGLAVEVVDVTQLYDEFSHGLLTPHAIRDFLDYAYHNWQRPAPLYVLLVGDASYDYHDNLETGYQNFVPTALFHSPIIGQTPTDNWYVSVSGDDFLPDMFVGRIAANAPGKISAAVSKILAYESLSNPGAWAQKSLFVAEDEANFQSISDQLIDQLPYNYSAARIYGEDYPNPPDATPQIVQNINQGTALITFIGHGSVTDWYWNELIFGLEHIAQLENGPNYPFLITGSCNNGLFAHPTKQTAFAEEFVTAAGQGGIGVWSPTGLGYSYWHEKLIEALFTQLFDNKTRQIGPATTAAKIDAYAQLGWREPVEISTLFGDPALTLHIIEPQIDLKLKTLTEKAIAGEEYQIEILVENNSDVAIADLTLLLQLGGGTLVSAVPSHGPNANQWDLDEIASQSTQQITITVSIPQQSASGSTLQLTAKLIKNTETIVAKDVSQTIERKEPDTPDPNPDPNPEAPTPTPMPPGQGDPVIGPTVIDGDATQLYIPLHLK